MKVFVKNLKMVITPVLSKARVLTGKLALVPDAASKKLINPAVDAVKSVFGKPKSIKDYIRFGDLYMSKRFLFVIAAVLAGAVFITKAYVIPYLEGKLWMPVIVINTPKFHTFEGRATVVSQKREVIYKGELDNGEVTGYGVLYDNGALKYDGGFTQNDFNGEGTLYYPDGNILFKGEFENGEYLDGRLYYEKGGLCYEGTFINGGYLEGTLYYENGERHFSGSFENGEFKSGVLYYVNGDIKYEGSFLSGEYDGDGVLYKDERILYNGQFVKGEYNGVGKLYSNSVLKYDGSFFNGEYGGFGKLYKPKSQRLLYEGDFSFGLYEGDGVLYYRNADRAVYKGGFEKGLYNGMGVLYNIHGTEIFKGEFYQGEINYTPFLNADTEKVREAFGRERSLEMQEFGFLLPYEDIGVIFKFNYADDTYQPTVQNIKFLKNQRFLKITNGMKISAFKESFESDAFTEYEFTVTPEEEQAFALASSELAEGDTAYCVKYDLDAVFIRAFSDTDDGRVIYYEIGGV